MRKILLGAIAAAALSGSPLVAEDESDLFAKLDANKDGSVTADEVEGDAKTKIERLLRTSDKDGDKKLSKEEFAAGLKEPETPRRPLGQGGGDRPGGGQFDARQFFTRMDENKDGKISKDEARGPAQENFDRLDANSDGSLSQDEFARFAGRRPDPREIEAMFDRADANGDGKLTKAEVPERMREGFARFLERIGDDSMNKEQFTQFLARPAQGRPGGAGQPGRPGEPGEPGRPGQPFGGRPPLFTALDGDSDGELSASEIEAAGKSLLTLDKNSDGKLSREELYPAPPEGRRPGEPRPGDARPGERRPGEPRPGAGRPNVEQLRGRLLEADTNKDGKLSKEEAPPMLKERFDQIDANSDGQIDATEARQAFQRRRD